LLESQTRTGGSPRRRAHISVGTDRPVTFWLVFTTSETEKPRRSRAKEELTCSFVMSRHNALWSSCSHP
jgi:hypothetical protein